MDTAPPLTLGIPRSRVRGLTEGVFMKHFKICLVAALALGLACGDDDGGTDSGMVDAGPDTAMPDGGDDDAGDDDAGMDDAGMDDAGDDDAGDDDAGMDDGGMDGGPMPEDGIAEVRAAADGTHDPALEVTGVTVTYLRPEIGSDPAGFFVQSVAAGPALFVAVDPTGTDPVLAVGDVIDFEVTETVTDNMHHRVLAITNLMRSDTGTDVSGLVQDLSDVADVVSAVGDYESELVSFTGTLTGTSGFAGGGHRSIQLTTAGVDDANLVFRSTDEVFSTNMLRDGCTVEIGPSPLWRRNDTAQAMGYVMADLTITMCPDPPGDTPDTAGQLVITEFLAGPTANEFFEVHNPSTDTTYNLFGCTVFDNTRPDNDAMILDSVEIAPGGYVTFSDDDEASPTAGLEIALNNGGDTIGIECGGTTIDEVTYENGSGGWPTRTDGTSLQLNTTALDATSNDDSANWCESTDAYGTMDNLGTPAAANIACPVVGVASLLITEYVEGSSNDKALELTNIGTENADLTTCEIRRWNNGRSEADGAPTDTYDFAGVAMLAPGGTFVICHESASGTLMPFCDVQDNGAANFNGDDSLEVYCGGTLVDSFGNQGEDPGSEWSGGGIGTQDETLRRLCTVTTGDTTVNDAFDPSVEYLGFANNTFDDLGTRSCP